MYFEDAKEDPLNVLFLDALEELGIPDGIDLKVKHLDVWYTRGEGSTGPYSKTPSKTGSTELLPGYPNSKVPA